MLTSRRRIFGHRVIRLWVEDSPDCGAGGITIRAFDEAGGGAGHLFVSDEDLRAAYSHFARGRIGGIAADIPGASAFVAPQHREAPRAAPTEAELTHELVTSLLDAVCFEENGFRDEWSIHLPGFGPRTRAEVLGQGLGPALRLAPGPGAPLVTLGRHVGEGERGKLPEEFHRPRPRRPLSHRLAKRPLESRLRALLPRDSAPAAAMAMPDIHPLSPHEAQPMKYSSAPLSSRRCREDTVVVEADITSRPSSPRRWAAQSRPSSASGCYRRPWRPAKSRGECFGKPGLLLLSSETGQSDQPWGNASSRSCSPSARTHYPQRSGSGPWPGRHVAPWLEDWMSTSDVLGQELLSSASQDGQAVPYGKSQDDESQ